MGNFRGGLLLPHPPVLLPEVGGNDSVQAALTYQAAEIPVARVTPETAARLHWQEQMDHGALVPLSLFVKAGFHGQLVVLSPGDLSCTLFEQFGRLVRGVIDKGDRAVAILASGDMSHYVNEESPYGSRPEGALFDAAVRSAIQDNDFLQLARQAAPIAEAAGECGFRSLCFLFGAAHDYKASLLSYEAPFGIGYAVAAWLP